eukprot:547164-Pelagomonas_calceolata.AAC.3
MARWPFGDVTRDDYVGTVCNGVDKMLIDECSTAHAQVSLMATAGWGASVIWICLGAVAQCLGFELVLCGRVVFNLPKC